MIGRFERALLCLLFLTGARGVAGPASAPSRDWSRTEMLDAMASRGFEESFRLGAVLTLVGTIEVRGACYRIVYYQWRQHAVKPGEQMPDEIYRVLVFRCDRQYLGDYVVDQQSAQPRIVGETVVVPGSPFKGRAISFDVGGPPPFVNADGYPIASFFRGDPYIAEDWTAEAGRRCYRIVAYSRTKVDPHAQGSPMLLDRRGLVFDCAKRYLGGYGPVRGTASRVSGTTISFDSDFANDTKFGSEIDLSGAGPPSKAVLFGREVRFAK